MLCVEHSQNPKYLWNELGRVRKYSKSSQNIVVFSHDLIHDTRYLWKRLVGGSLHVILGLGSSPSSRFVIFACTLLAHQHHPYEATIAPA